VIVDFYQLRNRIDLVGRTVVCLESKHEFYKVGKTHKVVLVPNNSSLTTLSDTPKLNGYSAKWLVLDDEDLKIEDFL
jgi:hypothetical protein